MCRQGGPVLVSGHYTVKLTNPLPAAPFNEKSTIIHEVKPNATDRFDFTVGDKILAAEAAAPSLYQIDVVLHHDDNSMSPVLAGTTLLSSPVFDGEDNGKGEYLEYFRYTSAGTDEENERYNQCIDKNRILAQRFFRLAGNRTPVVDTIEADMKNA
jgi:hypothetical protein